MTKVEGKVKDLDLSGFHRPRSSHSHMMKKVPHCRMYKFGKQVDVSLIRKIKVRTEVCSSQYGQIQKCGARGPITIDSNPM